jgi:hypothetical protein
MYKKMMALAVAAAMLVAGSASAQEFIYVGNSTATEKGGVGVATLSDLCADDFGADARMCTSEEVLLNNTALPADPNADPQWVLPVFLSGAYKIFDVTGVEGQPNSLSCSGWRSNSTTGMVVSNSGQFDKKGCGTARQVACCAPAP